MVATALTIAGSDSGGGAGIQADLKSFGAMGVFGCSVVTAITAQNTCDVTAVHPVPDNVVAAQIKAVLDDIRIDAIKIGMLGTPSMVETVARALGGFSGPVVLDPVMVAKSGVALLEDQAIAALKQYLLPHADLLTPNLPEADKLLGQTHKGESAGLVAPLLALGPKAVLIKGGHADGIECLDVLAKSGLVVTLGAPRIATRNTHGTGCSYSAAIAGCLARGMDLETAVRRAHGWLHAAIKRADGLEIGQGHGPVHHFHEMWA